jgi:hypothetical protein
MDKNYHVSARGRKSAPLPEDFFLDLKRLSERTSIGVRSLRDHIKSPSHPLPSYRVGGKILVNWLGFKEWIATLRSKTVDLDKMVDDIMKDLIKRG